MKISCRNISWALTPPLLALVLTTPCFAVNHFIGINFMGQPPPQPLASTEVAGVVPQANWNNVKTDGAPGGTSGTNIALLDEAGNYTALSLEYQANDNWNNDGPKVTPDEKLMWGILKTSGAGSQASFVLRNVPPGTYDVYLYTQENADEAYVNSTIGATTYYTISQHSFAGTFIQGTNTINDDSKRDLANYLKFSGVSPSGGAIQITAVTPLSSLVSELGIAAIQLVSTNAWPTNSRAPGITVQPVNLHVPQGLSGTFQLLIDGPWTIQWYSNNVPVPGATLNAFTTAPLLDQAGTTNQYYAVVSNNVTTVPSVMVHLILLPALPPGGIFYDPFDYVPGPLANQGDWSLLNTAIVTTNGGLSYTDSAGSTLQVGGHSLIAEIDWDPDSNIPRKSFGTNSYGGDNATNYLSYLFDFRNLSTSNSGYVGVSTYNVDSNGISEQFFFGKRWYVDFLGFESAPSGVFADTDIPYRTNGFLVIRLASQSGQTTMDMFFDPPLSGLDAETPVFSTTFDPLIFNTVGVNAGEWDGPKGAHRNDFTPPGPLVDEFRFGTTYASVAPVAPPLLTIQLLGTNVKISWPPAATGYTLQQRDNVATGTWIAAPVGNPVTIPATQASRFYRLSK